MQVVPRPHRPPTPNVMPQDNTPVGKQDKKDGVLICVLQSIFFPIHLTFFSRTFIMIYVKALIQQYFDYCIRSSVWGSIGVCRSERLQKLQNRVARLISFPDLNIGSSTLLSNLMGIPWNKGIPSD